MNERLVHEPIVMTDDDKEVYYVRCALCDKILWHPTIHDICKGASTPPAEAEPPALGINVSEGIGTKDIFGG